MDQKQFETDELDLPSFDDDLKQIHGIGPSIERRMRQAGIRTFEQLGRMSADEIFSTVGEMIGLTVERIEEQRWVEQARELAEKSSRFTAGVDWKDTPEADHLHYATFMVELLLDEENSVRRTRMVHIQSKTEEAWAGWDREELIGFFARYSGFNPAVEAAKAQAADEGGALDVQAGAAEEPQPPSNLQVASAGSDFPARSIPAGKPVNFQVRLNLAEAKAPLHVPLNYSAAVYVKRVGNSGAHSVGGVHGLFLPDKDARIQVKAPGLGEGVYRMFAVVELGSPVMEPKRAPAVKIELDGGLFQVYSPD